MEVWINSKSIFNLVSFVVMVPLKIVLGIAGEVVELVAKVIDVPFKFS